MKKLIAIALVPLTAATIYSCTKTAAVTPPSIQGKWSLMNDEVAQGVSAPSSLYSTNYTGTSADYFDFRSDNKLYIKEGAKLDTFSYQLSADNNIYISSPETAVYGIASSLNGVIKPLSGSSATIQFTPANAVWGAYYQRTVNLTR
ncbi:MAG: hypothetical protein ACHQHN_04135 [Sphingobacteriales bacterium]